MDAKPLKSNDPPRSRLSSARRRSGFTLVEVLIVVAVMVVVAAMAIKQFEPDASANLQCAAQVVMLDLDFTRSLAASNSSNYRMTINATAGTYFIRHVGTNSELNVLPVTSFHRTADSGRQLDAALTDIPSLHATVTFAQVTTGSFIAGSNGYIEFTPLGETTNTAASVIWLTAGVGTQKRYLPIQVNPITGLATVGSITATAPT